MIWIATISAPQPAYATILDGNGISIFGWLFKNKRKPYFTWIQHVTLVGELIKLKALNEISN
jgi:hypothetical protein